jgi:hypothetical protein
LFLDNNYDAFMMLVDFAGIEKNSNIEMICGDM